MRQPQFTCCATVLARKTQTVSGWGELPRLFLGLTQTCRQLRAEFGPVYRTETVYQIALPDLPNYMNEILLAGAKDRKDATGNLLIDLNYYATRADRNETGFLGLKPLIRLYNAANRGNYQQPKCKVDFRHKSSGEQEPNKQTAENLRQLLSFEWVFASQPSEGA